MLLEQFDFVVCQVILVQIGNLDSMVKISIGAKRRRMGNCVIVLGLSLPQHITLPGRIDSRINHMCGSGKGGGTATT